MTPKQGQIWTSTSRLTAGTTRVAIVDSDLIARARQRVIVAPVRPIREVPTALQLLTATAPDGQAVAIYDLVIIAKDTLTEHVGDLSPDALEQVKVALRARFDL